MYEFVEGEFSHRLGLGLDVIIVYLPCTHCFLETIRGTTLQCDMRDCVFAFSGCSRLELLWEDDPMALCCV